MKTILEAYLSMYNEFTIEPENPLDKGGQPLDTEEIKRICQGIINLIDSEGDEGEIIPAIEQLNGIVHDKEPVQKSSTPNLGTTNPLHADRYGIKPPKPADDGEDF